MNFFQGAICEIPNSICLACGRITKYETFITFLFKLAQSSAFLENIAFATKHSKVCNVELSSIQ
jgi:hypothetical protein